MRARINVLSETPGEWQKCRKLWSNWNQAKKTRVDGHLVPTPNEEDILYQAMLGIWPLGPSKNINRAELKQRIEAFFIKAAKEAKTYTNWTSPNEPHEAALRKFVHAIIDDSGSRRFRADFEALQEKLAFYGAFNSCSQLILKMTSPGVPDFYQGNEIWNFRLTDPDNREPVDFKKRMKMLHELKSRNVDAIPELCQNLLNHWCDGRLKLYFGERARDYSRVATTFLLKFRGKTNSRMPLLAAPVRIGLWLLFHDCLRISSPRERSPSARRPGTRPHWLCPLLRLADGLTSSPVNH